jgi:alkylation response protein AidB-like acyl-CoA dehydrogenase
MSGPGIMSGTETEDLEEFRTRARAFIRDNLRYVGTATLGLRHLGSDEEQLGDVAHDRRLQRLLYDGDLAGISVPKAYGGQGLTPDHQRVLNEELTGYEFPLRLQVPTMSPCLAVLLDFGTEEQKRQHIPAMLKGEEIWAQLLSEPSGGSDVAGALTTAVRDGDEWILNGEKVWTSGAWWSDWGLCLARTNWDVPKHRGLTVFIFAIHQPGVELHRIEMLNGNDEFCQEFITDLHVPDGDRVGEIDKGWGVGTRWMFHERMLYNSPYVTVPRGTVRSGAGPSMFAVAREAGRLNDRVARDLVGEARMLELVADALHQRMTEGIAIGAFSDQSAAVGRLFSGISSTRKTTIEFELAGSAGAAWQDGDGALTGAAKSILTRQTACIGGGTTEMARNVISERVLGMPRERTLDRDVAFRDVPRSAPPRP